MSNTRARPPVRLSLLDRLLAGDAPDPAREAGVASLRQSVRRDLEFLFNTRPCRESVPPELEELQASLLTYGLSDLQTRPMASERQREAFDASSKHDPAFRAAPARRSRGDAAHG